MAAHPLPLVGHCLCVQKASASSFERRGGPVEIGLVHAVEIKTQAKVSICEDHQLVTDYAIEIF